MPYNYYDLFEIDGVGTVYDKPYPKSVIQDIKDIICRYNNKEYKKERICNFHLLLYGVYNCDGQLKNTAPCPLEVCHSFCWQHHCVTLA